MCFPVYIKPRDKMSGGKSNTRLENPKKMGRKVIDFDWETLDKILQFRPSLEDTATIMKCSIDTVENRIKQKHKVTFSEYRNKRMANVRLTLVQKAIDMARNGDRVLLIFSLKNLCGWTDQPSELEKMKEVVNRLVIQYNETQDQVELKTN